jgi:hypothetical protein
MTIKNITNTVDPLILRFVFEESLRLVKFKGNNLEISMIFGSFFQLINCLACYFL